ncbi:hypothetical protein FJV41_23590 [Myxococcus llanfairpwllgwyngyllgogerychwyrndrobwllllantysiliogogogochensis]|uniref:Outer membrane protein beta-barrel domain-containing protein n=1 Tax=Myxococcus llanfairpwllgwyngyllgogerychwyrndrobwllllantysiliogogogochensis TaxID=2590453 RepID=A0A540WWX6_9BACT|nr:hypothetical protein FJV41_23590 [Myxococcus llanfairpwllgwyngyllgogerychwyrndrobwllllantysiliogogogochensis]
MPRERTVTSRRSSVLTNPQRVVALLIMALPPRGARAAEYVDSPYRDRSAFSLILGPGASYTELIDSGDAEVVKGLDALLDVGASFTVGYDGDEVFVLIRGSLREPDLSLVGGFRSVFGDESWQSFVDLGAVVHPFSGPWVGPRVALGLRHTFSERFAVYGGLGLTLGFGSGLRADAEGFTGLQWIFPVGGSE